MVIKTAIERALPYRVAIKSAMELDAMHVGQGADFFENSPKHQKANGGAQINR